MTKLKMGLFVKILLVIFSASLFMAAAIFGVQTNAVSADGVPTVEMIAGASVRNTAKKSGIRFSALVSKACFTDESKDTDAPILKDGYTAGMLIIDNAGYETAGKLDHTLDTNTYAICDVSVSVWDVSSEYNTDDQIVFNAVVPNIPDTAYASKLMLTARAYVFNGTEYIYSDAAAVSTRCMAQVSSIALAEGEEDTYGVLATHVDNAVGSVSGDFTVGGESDAEINASVKLGTSIDVAPVAALDYLTVALCSADETKVVIKDGKIVPKVNFNDTVAVTATLGSVSKTVNISSDKTGKYFSSVADNITPVYSEDENDQPTFEVTGGSDVADSSAVNIATGISLTAEHSYILTCKFNVVSAAKADGKANIHWALNFYTNSDNYKAFTQFNTASNSGESIANTYFGASCENKAVSLSFDLSPAADVSNLVLRTCIHGTYLSTFDFEISGLKVIDKADGDFVSDVMGARVNTNASNVEAMLLRDAYTDYVTDSDLLVTGNKYGILMDKKADTVDGYATYGARYKLNMSMTAGKKYKITFKVIDLGIVQSASGRRSYVGFGLQGESLGGSTNSVSLYTFMSGGYVTTDTIKGVDVFTVTINNYTAATTKDNAVFNVQIFNTNNSNNCKKAQKFIVTGISITEVVDA